MSLLDKLRSWNSSSGRLATIDTVKAAPPPSPLAPIDLTDPAQVAAVMDLAARIGDILLSAGTSNRDTRAQVHAVTAAYGLLFCHVDITLNTITVFTTIGTTKKTPVSVFRVVRSLTTDFSKLTEVDRLIRSIQAGATPPDVAEKILNELSQTHAKYRFRTAVFGWGFLGAAVSMLLGGTFLVAAISFVVSLVIMGGSVWLDRNSLPLFFQYIFGGFMATVPAAVAYSVASHYGMYLSPSHIVAAGIVVMMSNLAMVQSLQDGITGAPVTASARFFETLLLTGAIVAGVGAGIQVAQLMGITLPPLEAAVSLAAKPSVSKVIAGAIASAAFAVGCFAELSAVTVSGLTAAAGSFVFYYVLIPLGIGPVVSIAIAATFIGLAGGLLARRFLIPPLITAIAGITPMLPGLSIYRGMYAALNEQVLLGFTNVALALSICCGLAAGVVLGEWVARRVRRPQRFNPYKAFRRTRRYSFRQAQAAAEKRAEQEEQEKLALRRRMSKGHTPKYTATKRRRGL